MGVPATQLTDYGYNEQKEIRSLGYPTKIKHPPPPPFFGVNVAIYKDRYS